MRKHSEQIVIRLSLEELDALKDYVQRSGADSLSEGARKAFEAAALQLPRETLKALIEQDFARAGSGDLDVLRSYQHRPVCDDVDDVLRRQLRFAVEPQELAPAARRLAGLLDALNSTARRLPMEKPGSIAHAADRVCAATDGPGDADLRAVVLREWLRARTGVYRAR